MVLKARSFQFTFPRPVLVMGILNVTPDSFSDGGRFTGVDAAVEHALKLQQEGADIIDVGGESTRPGAVPVEEREELRRVLPVLKELQGRLRIPLSIDTMKVRVAEEALAMGASFINDVGACRQDDGMWRLTASSGAAYVCMHMQGTPRTMHLAPAYDDVVAEVRKFFEERLERLAASGVNSDQIILDPGIGFGKKMEHNLELLRALAKFRELARPMLVGVSRKSFLAKVSGGDTGGRLAAGLACACLAVAAGTQMIRTHDVRETVQAVRMTEAVLSGSV